jgi:hypothetical protein
MSLPASLPVRPAAKVAAEPPDAPPGVLRPRQREAANGHAFKDT